KPTVLSLINPIVDDFCDLLLRFPEVVVIVGDSDSQALLKGAQKKYILQLFNGTYEMEYVHSRLRIGAMCKRLGVDQKFYVARIYTLKSLMTDVIQQHFADSFEQSAILKAIEKLLLLDQS